MKAVPILMSYVVWAWAIIGVFSASPFSVDGAQWLTLAVLCAAFSLSELTREKRQ